jgi:hypothetical protein
MMNLDMHENIKGVRNPFLIREDKIRNAFLLILEKHRRFECFFSSN